MSQGKMRRVAQNDDMITTALAKDGYVVFAHDPAVARWAVAAKRTGHEVLAQGRDFRHGRTWFVGVDALPNNDTFTLGLRSSSSSSTPRSSWLASKSILHKTREIGKPPKGKSGQSRGY